MILFLSDARSRVGAFDNEAASTVANLYSLFTDRSQSSD